MVVEIKQSDTPEEVEKKLKTFREEIQKKQEEKDQERRSETKKFFGILKRDEIDPVEWQRKMRDEWD